jgi:hypothetical protein
MKFAIQIVFIIIVGYVLEIFFPWWTIAIAAFIGGAIFNSRANFAAGFLAIGLLWAVKALLIEGAAAAPLSDRVAMIFSLDKPLLFVVTAAIGGLVAAFACMAGGALRKSKKRSSYY